MPSSGMAMTEGAILEWRVSVGDPVRPGQVLVEIETDKTTVEVESEWSGVVAGLLFKPGDVVPVGETIAVVASDDESADEPLLCGTESTPLGADADSAEAKQSASTAIPPSDAKARGPLARARFRNAIAAAVTESWTTVPHFSVSREIAAAGALQRLEGERRATPEATLTDVLIVAAVKAMDALPEVRADAIGLAVDGPVGVGIAVLTGLVDCDVPEVASKRKAAVQRIREGGFNPDDVNVTPAMTVSNLGALGVDWFTGIIPRGQSLLLTIGVARERGSLVEGRPGPTLIVTATVDHRAYDGADAARYLQAFTSATLAEGN